MTSLSSLETYVISRCLPVTDVSECMGRDAMSSSSVERVEEVLAVDVVEVYSPERIAELCGRLGFKTRMLFRSYSWF